jgi:hypothetical protein
VPSAQQHTDTPAFGVLVPHVTVSNTAGGSQDHVINGCREAAAEHRWYSHHELKLQVVKQQHVLCLCAMQVGTFDSSAITTVATANQELVG